MNQMDKKLVKILMCLRSNYGMRVFKTPSGNFILCGRDDNLMESAVWILKEKCGCSIVQHDNKFEVIFERKEELHELLRKRDPS